MKSMNGTACTIRTQELFDEVGEMIGFLQTSFQEESAAHQVEAGLWKRTLELGRHAFGTYLALFGDGDAGEQMTSGRRSRGAATRCVVSAWVPERVQSLRVGTGGLWDPRGPENSACSAG